ncbi:probable E3 ubiquitin-protein ligase TRIML1 [Gracilinanus agilis]|uniref:probable E3 ubiquitin-protein ligase TRIML1 n=1 Tax=Gracilinanus agilis TaxID=191870 RepID=UPI001CFD9742|nr:probable E3 ubiquitin-protein ligase TRIML1 [Gracilinanus agilis]
MEAAGLKDWEVGICPDAHSINISPSHVPDDMKVLVGFSSGQVFLLWNPHYGHRECQPLQKVGIFLDFDRGQVAFSDATDGSLLFSVVSLTNMPLLPSTSAPSTLHQMSKQRSQFPWEPHDFQDLRTTNQAHHSSLPPTCSSSTKKKLQAKEPAFSVLGPASEKPGNMDARSWVGQLKDELTCPICLGYFRDPVTVRCGHSFCTPCLLRCCQGAQATFECPRCWGTIHRGDWMPNRSLQNLCLTGQRLRPHLLHSLVGPTTCGQHGKREELFCEEDRAALCECCSSAPQHEHHHVLPLQEAAQGRRQMLQEAHTLLQAKEEELQMALASVARSEARCQVEANILVCSLGSEYEKMHQLLWEEERRQVQQVRLQSTRNLHQYVENRVKLEQQMQHLQAMIEEVQDTLDKEPLQMLQDRKDILERKEELLLLEPNMACPHWDSQPITGLREMLRSFHRDITMDPQTASPHLVLSQDLKSVCCGGAPQDLLGREDTSFNTLTVLGAQTFSSGKHYWEVEVAGLTEWEVGICPDAHSTNSIPSHVPDDMRVLVGLTSGQTFLLWNPHYGYRECQPLQKVGIFLDFDRGHVAFYDATDGSLLYSHARQAFQGPLRPCFSPCFPNGRHAPASLNICPRHSPLEARPEVTIPKGIP